MAGTAPKTRTSAGKKVIRKSNPRSRKKRPARRVTFNVRRLILFFILFVLFMITIGAVGYVIFFRVVVAAELPGNTDTIIFEEPDSLHPQTTHHLPDAGGATQSARIAIIIDDMGYHEDIGRKLLALDLNLSFSFLPYAPFTGEFEAEAYRRGRTVMLHLPLEPRNLKYDPGPGALYLNESPQKRHHLLEADLQQVPHATGVNNHMGSRYTESEAMMVELIDFLADSDLFFVDSFTTAGSRGLEVAMRKGLPAARRHIFLDNVQQPAEICLQIEKLVEMSRVRDGAIGIAHPHAETLDALETCAPEILGQVEMVGAGELVR